MALKTLMLQRQLEEAEGKVTALREAAAALKTREAEIEAAMNEAETAEEKSAVETEIDRFDADSTANEEALREAENTVAELRTKLTEAEARSAAPAAAPNVAQKGITMSAQRRFRELSMEERTSMVSAPDVKDFIQRFRDICDKRGVTGAQLTFPTTMLPVLTAEIYASSKLLPFVTRRQVQGLGRQPVVFSPGEAVWTEACAEINEIAFGIRDVVVDGYMLAGLLEICKYQLQESNIDLAGTIVSALAESRAKAIDRSILYGKGAAFKMPLGIVTRLAQTSQPESWGADMPAWTDLHSSNIIKLNIASSSGTSFYAELASSLGVAAPKSSGDGLFWVMNRKTHYDLMAKALAFNSAAALVSGISNTMPVVGGTIIEIEDLLSDYEIVGGFGGNFLWADHGAEQFDQTDQVKWAQNKISFKSYGYHDGFPVFGEAFVVINYNNVDPATSKAFPIDYANMAMNVLTVTAAAGTASGDTVVTVGNMVDSSNNTLKYKAKATIQGLKPGDTVGGWTALTSGTTQITAAAGVQIAVVELDSAGRVVSAGQVTSVPKT